MKKALLFALCVLTGVCAQALEVGTVDGVVTVTLAQGEHLDDLNSADIKTIETAFKNANPLKIKLVGEFNERDLFFANLNPKPVYLDLRYATFLNANQQLGNLKDNLVELYLPTNANYTRVPDNFAQGAQYLETVHFPVNILEIGANAFDGCKNITELKLPTNLQKIEGGAFKGLSIKEIVIPGTVEELKKGAFWECNSLTKVTFSEHLGEDGKSDVNMTIEEQAFGNDKDVWDVYVESLGTLNCELHAFEYDVTNAQTDASHRLATLHFPESKIAEYVNLDHTLDIETSKDPGKLQAWLNAHRNEAGDNGWFEFVNSGPSNPKEKQTGEKFLKTFSDYNYARLVPDGVRAYIVNKVEKQGNHYVLSLKRLLVIPARTGVILYGNITGTSLAMSPVVVDGKLKLEDGKEVVLSLDQMALTRDNWNNLQGDDATNYKNYLVPTSTAEGNGVSVEPFETDEAGNVTFRNFGMGRFSKTESGKKYAAKEKGGITSDYEGFFRLKKSTIGEGKAYLRLAADEYNDPKGGEALVLKDDYFNQEYDGENLKYSALWWDGRVWNASTTYDWGSRDANNNINKEEYFVKFKGEPVIVENGDDATLILSPETQNMGGSYFTLQGVRIQKPTQSGIYIKDGKKIYVK
ncbi:MAG: leucine-rich repeat domain-containing protein [Bacteroidaceae bacterium]|nr:leucine-rich repeat domain-containing protein [Bacteroidaceae bacterium]